MHVSLRKTIDGKIFLSFRDNGGGLPDNFKTKGTGFELMNDLVDQIDGELNVRSSQVGTEISIIH
jgi:two-component sensor histidine kinase